MHGGGEEESTNAELIEVQVEVEEARWVAARREEAGIAR